MASVNTKRRADADPNDLYITPLEGLQAMDLHLNKDDRILFDPCAGMLDMEDYFQGSGVTVYSNELYPVLHESHYTHNMDFLEMTSKDMPHVDCIIMNPPYKLTHEFIDKALGLCDRVVMFNRLAILEGQKRGYEFKSKRWNLKKISVFSFRVSCLKGVDRVPSANAVAYAVYEFDKNYTGEPVVDWITKEDL